MGWCSLEREVLCQLQDALHAQGRMFRMDLECTRSNGAALHLKPGAEGLGEMASLPRPQDSGAHWQTSPAAQHSNCISLQTSLCFF